MVRLWSTPPPPPSLPSETLQIILSETPKSSITPSTFTERRAPLPLPSTLSPNQTIVRVLYLSCDPAMRVWLDPRRSYLPPIPVGSVMRCAGVGEVVHAAGGLRVGDVVFGLLGWTEFSVIAVDQLEKVHVPRGLPVSAALGVLGITGMTAYFGIVEVGEIKKGDVVVVSAAAGATGGVVCQIAKNVYGCYVVGIAGGAEKCRYLREDLGIVAVDYKGEEGVDAGLKKALEGRSIDVYFDNVGGKVLEAALKRIGRGARVVVCGAISGYNKEELMPGPYNYVNLIATGGVMKGFLLRDFESRFGEARRVLGGWIRGGDVSFREDVVVGLKNAPMALGRLFEGKNIGKVVVKVAVDKAKL